MNSFLSDMIKAKFDESNVQSSKHSSNVVNNRDVHQYLYVVNNSEPKPLPKTPFVDEIVDILHKHTVIHYDTFKPESIDQSIATVINQFNQTFNIVNDVYISAAIRKLILTDKPNRTSVSSPESHITPSATTTTKERVVKDKPLISNPFKNAKEPKP